MVPEWWPLDGDYGFWVRTQTLSVKVNMDTGELVESADPDFTKLTVTLAEGGLNTDEVLTLQTLRPGAAPPEIELEVGMEYLNLSTPADYIIIDYRFQTTGGRDLDTRTGLTWPEASKFLGWDQNGGYTWDYFFHGGDNTGNGYESVYIDIEDLRAENPGAKQVKIQCSAAWYGSPISGDVQLTVMGYVGGNVSKAGSYQWQVSDAEEETGDIVFNTTTQVRRQSGTECDLLANITYDWDIGALRCLLPESTPEDPKECPKGS